MITIKEVSAVSVPLPPPGKARLFLDVADGHYKILKSSGAVVDLESAALGSVDSELVTYLTNDVLLWSWATSIPLNAEIAFDMLAGKVKELDATINDIAPAKPPLLSALALGVTATQFQGKLPSGLPAGWYTENAPGDIVNGVIYSASYNINALGFYVGKKNNPTTYGQLNYLLNAVVTDIVDMTIPPGTGTDGVLTVTAVNVFNNFWESADAVVAVVQAGEGLATYRLVHTNSGSSTIVKTFWDDNAVAPSFAVALTATQNTKVSKWLSGIEYYGLGSTFNVSYSIANAFRKVYVPVGLTTLALTGVTVPHTVDPSVTPAYTDTFVVTNHVLTLNDANKASISPVLSVVYAKPNNANALNGNFNIKTGLGLGINTYGIVSTLVTDSFQDEAQRLNVTGLTAFVSTAALPNGEAQVRSGSLVYGNTDYPAKTGNQQYTRRFNKAAANSGLIVFGGLNVANIAPLGTGSINVLLILETENRWFDLGRPFGSNNGTGSGVDAANSRGGRVSLVGANNLNWTIGTFTTSNNSNRYRLLIIFRDATYSITSLTTS